MLFLLIGIAMLVMKVMEIAPVATLPWWMVFVPFAAAVAWWTWSDKSGRTKRLVVEKENARKQARVDKNREALGIQTKKRK